MMCLERSEAAGPQVSEKLPHYPRPAPVGRTTTERFGGSSHSAYTPRDRDSATALIRETDDQNSSRQGPTTTASGGGLSLPDRGLRKSLSDLAPLRSALAGRKPPPPQRE